MRQAWPWISASFALGFGGKALPLSCHQNLARGTLVEFTQNTQGVCWGGVLHFLLSGNFFSAGKDSLIVVVCCRREGIEPEEI